MTPKIRVLIAEDSVTTRELLCAILTSDPAVEVVGEARNGVEAVEMTRRLKPNIVTMDIKMPLMDGFEATRQIMATAPTPIVIVSASVDVREVEVSMHALRAGALTVLPKPPGPATPLFEEARRRFVDTIKAMAEVKVVRHWPERRLATRSGNVRALGRPRLVAMAASTGGPAALAQILADMPADFPLPVVLVQHIARDFVGGFAAWLNAGARLRVKVAEDGEVLAARTVYVAPDDRQLGVTAAGTAVVNLDPPVDGFRPSASHLFESVGRAYGAAAIAVILTGMGRDGVAGLRVVHDLGGKVLAQDEESSVVHGMPGAAVAEGLADLILPLNLIALRLRELAAP